MEVVSRCGPPTPSNMLHVSFDFVYVSQRRKAKASEASPPDKSKLQMNAACPGHMLTAREHFYFTACMLLQSQTELLQQQLSKLALPQVLT